MQGELKEWIVDFVYGVDGFGNIYFILLDRKLIDIFVFDYLI